MDDNGRSGGGGFFPGFLIGALVGGAVAMLMSQEETRDLLIGKAREAGNFAVDAGGDLRGKVNEAKKHWQANAEDLYERGKTVVENARTTFDSAVDEARSTSEQTRDDLQHQADV
jgi:gas vesicle protein